MFEGISMFAFLAFAAAMVLLGVLAGSGYSQSWATWWGIFDR
jgi:hypothetical protein